MDEAACRCDPVTFGPDRLTLEAIETALLTQGWYGTVDQDIVREMVYLIRHLALAAGSRAAGDGVGTELPPAAGADPQDSANIGGRSNVE